MSLTSNEGLQQTEYFLSFPFLSAHYMFADMMARLQQQFWTPDVMWRLEDTKYG